MAFLPALTSPAWAGEDLTSLTNADRTSGGLPALVTASDLQSFAQRRAEEMARANKLWHTSNLGTQVANWQRVGENVGRGPSLRDIQSAFMQSASHRENIMHPAYTQLGVGVASDGGQLLYVAVIFRQPKTGAAAPAPTSPPTTAPKPRPKPVVAVA
ncbi:MAG: CAP domain-containing protein, partial [Acidimicrobiia bacterium]